MRMKLPIIICYYFSVILIIAPYGSRLRVFISNKDKNPSGTYCPFLTRLPIKLTRGIGTNSLVDYSRIPFNIPFSLTLAFINLLSCSFVIGFNGLIMKLRLRSVSLIIEMRGCLIPLTSHPFAISLYNFNPSSKSATTVFLFYILSFTMSLLVLSHAIIALTTVLK